MKRLLRLFAVAAAVPLLSLTAFLLLRPGPFERHFHAHLPESARMLFYERTCLWPDPSWNFVFECKDDALLELARKQWRLKPVANAGEIFSFTSMHPPLWWLTDRDLKALPEKYSRIEWELECYWCVWVDRAKGRVYAEKGRW